MMHSGKVRASQVLAIAFALLIAGTPVYALVRLLTHPAWVHALCVAADWYPAARCISSAVMQRAVVNVLAVSLPVAIMIFAVALPGRAGDAVRTRIHRDFDAVGEDVRAGLRAIERREWASVSALFAIALALRASLLQLPVRSDENQSLLLYGVTSVQDVLWNYDQTNNHILFEILSRLGISALGAHPWVARLPEAITGALIAPLTFLCLARAYGQRAALLAAGVAASLPYLVAFGTNARGYSLAACCVLVAFACLLRAAERENLAWMLLGAIAIALTLFTNPAVLHCAGAVAAWSCLMVLARRGLGRAVVFGAVLALTTLLITWSLFSPALVAHAPVALFRNPWVLPPPWSEFTGTFWVTLDGTLREIVWSWFTGVPPAIGWLLAAVLLIAGVFEHRALRPPFLVTAVVWSLVLSAATHRIGYVRVFLPFVPIVFAITWRWLLDHRRSAVLTPARCAMLSVGLAALLALLRNAAATFYMT